AALGKLGGGVGANEDGLIAGLSGLAVSSVPVAPVVVVASTTSASASGGHIVRSGSTTTTSTSVNGTGSSWADLLRKGSNGSLAEASGIAATVNGGGSGAAILSSAGGGVATAGASTGNPAVSSTISTTSLSSTATGTSSSGSSGTSSHSSLHYSTTAKPIKTKDPVKPGDWICPNSSCRYHNFARRVTCVACGTSDSRAGRF
ncbi:hypothetical protein HDU76_005765, partial [Blyttiomyces sp. JEL0837]